MIIKFAIKYFFSTLFFVFISFSCNADSYPPDFSDLAAKLSPAVVSISITMSNEPSVPGIPQFPPGSPFEDFFNDFFERRGGQRPPRERQPQQAMGSGFIIDSSGLIVTNNHVIEKAISINVILSDSRSYSASLIGKDNKTDLALIKIDVDENLPFVKWGDSNEAKVGNWVLAIGNPFGLVNTVTTGIISARARDISAGPFDDSIQTDAAINRGNSGGPLFNLEGEVIGVNTAIFSPSGGSVGIGFAVPSDLAKGIIFQLKEYGKTRRGWLGVRIQSVTEDIANSLGLEQIKGALVAGVMPDGPAKSSGMKSGDVILEFDGKEVIDMRALPRIVAETEIDKPVNVKIWRNERLMNLQVVVGEMKEEVVKNINDQEAQGDIELSVEIKELGLLVSAISEDIKRKFNIPLNTKGVIVLNVQSESDAASKGILPGDIIMEISQNKIFSPSDLKFRLDQEINSSRDFALLLINRKGTLSYIAVKINKN